jgi:hypothetical protein
VTEMRHYKIGGFQLALGTLHNKTKVLRVFAERTG